MSPELLSAKLRKLDADQFEALHTRMADAYAALAGLDHADDIIDEVGRLAEVAFHCSVKMVLDESERRGFIEQDAMVQIHYNGHRLLAAYDHSADRATPYYARCHCGWESDRLTAELARVRAEEHAHETGGGLQRGEHVYSWEGFGRTSAA